MLDIPSHYTIQYFPPGQEAAYRAQLHRSLSKMLRHACAEERRRGQAARRLLRVRHGLLPQPRNESSEISFHVSLPCLQKRISGGTSLNMGPRAELHLSGCGTSKERERENERVSRRSGGARLRTSVPGPTLTAPASLVANSLSIAEHIQLFLCGSHLHPCG